MSAGLASAPAVGRTAAPPLDVVLVVDSLTAGGGAERYVGDLAIALLRRGHGVTVACSVDGPLRPELEAAGVQVVPLARRLVKRRCSPRYAGALHRLLRSRRPDVVHAHIYASATAAALATLGTSVPLVLTEHTEAPWRGPIARLLSRWTYRRAAHIHGVSTAVSRMLVDGYGVDAGRAEYVPTAVTAARGPGEPVPDGCGGYRLVGSVNRLAPEKGIDVLLQAVVRIAPRVPDVRFLVVGDGPQRAELEESAKRLGIADRVEFLGHRENARGLIARLQLLVIASRSDGAPLVVHEARHAGVPVVATRVGGLPDQIRDGDDGLLVDPGEPVQLARAILTVLDDPARAGRIAASGRARLEAWPHERLVDRVEATYRAVAGVPAG
jgi:glycosyltransferase involved in cell wall biosynthesis